LRDQSQFLRNITPAAELTWLLLMACARRLRGATQHVHEGGWVRQDFKCERNDLFMGVARDSLGIINGGLAERRCTVEDGVAALKILDACRLGSAEGRTVTTG
jgi:predicted dehydrogenase